MGMSRLLRTDPAAAPESRRPVLAVPETSAEVCAEETRGSASGEALRRAARRVTCGEPSPGGGLRCILLPDHLTGHVWDMEPAPDGKENR